MLDDKHILPRSLEYSEIQLDGALVLCAAKEINAGSSHHGGTRSLFALASTSESHAFVARIQATVICNGSKTTVHTLLLYTLYFLLTSVIYCFTLILLFNDKLY